jgi:CBS domain containing-hemolysin-like protein
MIDGSERRARVDAIFCAAIGALFLLASPPARAFLLEGDALDAAANVLALIVIVVVPVVLIGLFWMVHVLPEKIAHKRNHPQFEAIRTLCLLSLVFGGILWPLAWLWAYSKPVLHKLAYGTDKLEHSEAAPAASTADQETEALKAEFALLRGKVDRMLAQQGPTRELTILRDELVAIEPRVGQTEDLH